MSTARSALGVWWGQLVTVHPHRDQQWNALQVGCAVSLPLAVVLGLGRADLSAYVAFGGLSAAYGNRFGRADRLRAQLVTGAALTGAVGLGVLASTPQTHSSAAPAMALVSALVSAMGLLVTRRHGLLPVPSLFLVFAAGTVSARQHRWGDVPLAIGCAAAAVIFGVLLGQLSVSLRTRLVPDDAPDPVAWTAVLRQPGIRPQLICYVLSPALAGLVASAVGHGHPYWAAVSAIVPLSASTISAQLARVTLRFAGTLVGIGVTYVVIAAALPTWAMLTVIAALQVLVELFITRHYGIAVAFITPLALLLGYLAAPSPAVPLLLDRLVQTIYGVAVGIAVLLVVRPSRRRPKPLEAERDRGGKDTSPTR